MSLRSEQVPTGVPLLGRLNRGGFFVAWQLRYRMRDFHPSNPTKQAQRYRIDRPVGTRFNPY